jgi:hypothetical protein
MNRIKCGIVSMTGSSPTGDDSEYLAWHLLDHMPEQFQLAGMLNATRWTADDACVAARLEVDDRFVGLRNIVQYLIGDPVQQTIDDFLELGQRLRERGRFPMRMPSLQLGAYALLHAYAAPRALISADVVPFRPHRGVIVIVEEPTTSDSSLDEWLVWAHAEHAAQLLDTHGCAGAWMFGSTNTWQTQTRLDVGQQFVTIAYCDDDPVVVTAALAPLLRERWSSGAVRPLLAAPLRSMIRWDAWP